MPRDPVVMSLLRDLELRSDDQQPMPEGFWRRLPVEYLFYRQLRALKIRTPRVMKINVCCCRVVQPYDGKLWDGVTSVEVETDLAALEGLPALEFSRACVALMVAGVKTVLAFFGVADSGVDEAGEKALAGLENFSLPVGKPAGHPDGGLSAQVHVQLAGELQACVAVLLLKAGRKPVGTVPICTTFPSPEWALDSLQSLAWVGSDVVEVGFRTAGLPTRTVFGRVNFDASGLDHVKRVPQGEPAPPLFARDVVFEVAMPAWSGRESPRQVW